MSNRLKRTFIVWSNLKIFQTRIYTQHETIYNSLQRKFISPHAHRYFLALWQTYISYSVSIFDENGLHSETLAGADLSICKEGCRFSMGSCRWEPYCSADSDATIPTLPLLPIVIKDLSLDYANYSHSRAWSCC
jgi:hypothetical protein